MDDVRETIFTTREPMRAKYERSSTQGDLQTPGSPSENRGPITDEVKHQVISASTNANQKLRNKGLGESEDESCIEIQLNTQ